MEQGTSLDDILSGEQPELPVEAVQSEPEIARDEQGRFATNETGVETSQEAPAEPVPPTEQQGLPKEEFAALKDERRKRQALEQQVADMAAQFATMQRQAPQEQPADFWEDPNTFLETRLDQFGNQLIQRWQQQAQVERISASEAAAKAKYADYEDAFHAFRQAVEANPSLAQQMASNPEPAEFAYTKGKLAMELTRVGSIDELLKAERAKWEQEARAAVAPSQTFPQSTVTERSVGGRTGPAWTGPTPLSAILS